MQWYNLVKYGFLSYLQEDYFQNVIYLADIWINVKKSSNVGSVPLVSMETDTREFVNLSRESNPCIP